MAGKQSRHGRVMCQGADTQSILKPGGDAGRPAGWALTPLESLVPQAADLSSEAQARWIWAFLAIGFAIRLIRYLLRFPLWEDEAMLSANYLDRSYLELLKPLNYCQVAPPLFLWGQLTIVKLLGFSEYSLRLVPFLCSMGSLAVFWHIARRLLHGTAMVLAVGLFAVAYPLSRYAAEAKPYGCDLFIASTMIALVIEWLRRPGENRWLWALAAMIGPVVGFSYPSVFVGGGISLIVAHSLWFSRRRGWIPWALFNLIMVASFLVMLQVSRAAVGDTVQKNMQELYWSENFPPMTEPLNLAYWLLKTHAGGMLAYPVGGPNWASTLSFVCCAAGVTVLARKRQWLLLAILLAPLGLNFVAAAMHRFPYGGHARMTLFMAPAFCLLISLGFLELAVRLAAGRKIFLAALAGLCLLASVAALRDLTYPYKSGTTLRAREFAHWFWFEFAHEGELVCLQTDLGKNLSPGKFRCGWSSLYFCNQRIYSPRHARQESPQWDGISAERPLRCVVYRSPTEEQFSPPSDPRIVEAWLEDMQSRYELIGRDRYPIQAYDKWDRRLITADYVEVFKFTPRRDVATRNVTGPH